MNIRELARIAGVSKSTVAYALKNSPKVSQETCRRIQALAKKHGYTSNPAVTAFMRGVRDGQVPVHRHNLCYISSLDADGKSRRLRHGNEAELIRGAQTEAKQLGCNLDVIDWGLNQKEQIQLNRIIEARGIQGIFFGPATVPHTQMNLDWDTVAMISSGFTVEEPRMDRTAADLFTAVFEAGQRAMDRKYDCLVLAIQNLNHERVGWRWLAAITTLRELYGPARIQILQGTDAEMVKQVLAMKKKRTSAAVLSHSDFLKDLQVKGIRFPVDMGFIATDKMDEAPEITAIQQPHFEAGRLGLRHLYSAVENGVLGIPETPCRLAVSCGWHEGMSLPDRL